MKKFVVAAVLAWMAMCGPSSVYGVPAFPGAEGWGATATGGRGGAVYEVTNLNDNTSPGSFRYAVTRSGARTVVFRVSGTIHLTSDLSISNGNLTIAGQTAPGDGICIANGSITISCSNVIIRYMRFRLGDCWPNGTDNNDSDAIWGRYQNPVILDHVSASWSIDETLSFYANTNFTAQWCLITESLRYSHHEKGAHGYGGIWGGTNVSYHHNLLAHHSSRNPRIDGELNTNADLRNNVIYNWAFNSCYGGEYATVNIVNCYYKYGPATSTSVRDRIVNPSLRKDAAGLPIVPHTYGLWYVNGNYVNGYPTVTADNWAGGVDPEGGSGELSLCKSLTPFPVATTYPVTQQTAQNAYSYVLASAGCSLARDSIDTRIIGEVQTGTATYGGLTPPVYGSYSGIIDSQTQVGGWPTLNSTTPPVDSDHDGMPDDWEIARGLNPYDAADRNGDRNSDGYTNLEEYINGLCPDPYGADLTPPQPDPMTWDITPHATSDTSVEMTATTATDASGVEYYFTCTAGGGHSSGWQDSSTYTDTGLTSGVNYTYTVKARDKSTMKNVTAPSSPATTSPPDTTAPTPDPMTWATVPYGSSFHSISMTATTATDVSGVEYYFTCTTGGGHDSGWQNSPTYIDLGLTEGATYSYTVTARDKSVGHNQTGASGEASASTLVDNAAPSPDPMTWDMAPTAAGLYSITMTATTASDESGVEYFFACTAGSGHDSGWQDETQYTDTGLVNNTTYAYRVIARDKSLLQNETQWSDEREATTVRYECTPSIIADLDGDCQTDFQDYALLVAQWSSAEPNDPVVNGSFDSDTSGWLSGSMAYYIGTMTSSFDGTEGAPAGSARLEADTTLTDVDGHYFYQIVPVISGNRYRLSGEWKGSLTGLVPSTPGALNWLFLFVGFTDDDPFLDGSVWETLAYAKAYGDPNFNIGTTGSWDWEPLISSPYDGPTDGIFTATADHAVIAFGLGGTYGSGPTLVNIDNIGFEEVPDCPPIDLNDDCSLDFLDVRLFAADWLTCNRVPSGECLTQ